MKHPHPSKNMIQNKPSISEESIYRVYIQGRASAALAVGVHLGIFDVLSKEPQNVDRLASTLGVHLRGLRAILRSLSAMNILEFHLETNSYSCSEAAKIYLCKNQPAYIGALIEMEIENFLTPQKILSSLRDDKPSVYDNQDVWASHSEDIEQASNFTAAMHSISTGPAIALAEQDFWKDLHHILDVGAGSGALSIALLQKYPHLRATLIDIPSVCNITSQYLRQYGVYQRSEVVKFDMFSKNKPYPTGHDAILFSQILHDWNFEQGRFLLKKAYDSLQDGGRVVIHEKLTNPHQKHTPVENALVNLDMLIWTEGQQYSFDDLRKILTDIGYVEIYQRKTHTYWSCIIGTK